MIWWSPRKHPEQRSFPSFWLSVTTEYQLLSTISHFLQHFQHFTGTYSNMKASADPDLLSDLCAFPYKQQQELSLCKAEQARPSHWHCRFFWQNRCCYFLEKKKTIPFQNYYYKKLKSLYNVTCYNSLIGLYLWNNVRICDQNWWETLPIWILGSASCV